HLAELVGVAGDGIDQAFGHCAGYPGPGTRPPAKIGWLRPHQLPARALYGNTGGRGLGPIRPEARRRGGRGKHLDHRHWARRSAAGVRRDLQAYVAGRADLSWARNPPAPPPLPFRIREAIHKVAVPLALLLLSPALLAILPFWIVALRIAELRDRTDIKRPAQ